MRILHTADWHLGKKLDRFDRMAEQQAVLAEICEIAEAQKVDAVIIAGDLYDTFNPPNEAAELFYKTLKRLANDGKCAVIAIAGNHDSPDRVEAPDPLARECGIILTGYPHSKVPVFELDSGLAVTKTDAGFIELKLPNNETPLRLILTPYANEIRLKRELGVDDPGTAMREALEMHWQKVAGKYCDSKGVNILMAHLYVMKKGGEEPEEPEEERPINIGGAQAVYSENLPKEIQYCALGHLHRLQVIDKKPCPVVYSGSPLSYSFAEAGQKKHVVILDAEASKEIKWENIELTQGKPVLRKSFDDMDKAVQWLLDNQNAIVELTIESETYLTAEDRRRIHQAHEFVIGPIPVIKGKNVVDNAEISRADLTKSMEELFVDYFKSWSGEGQEPNEEIKTLFKEIIGTEASQ